MSWLDGLRHRVHTLLSPSAYERELREEFEFHESLDAAQQRDAGAARRRFGNRTYYQEETRRMTWLASFDGLRQDVGYAWRSIKRSPASTAMIVATLALGLGANAATFSVLDVLYLRAPDGIHDPSTLQRVWFWHSGVHSADQKPFYSSHANYPFYAAVRAGDEPGRIAIAARDNALYMRRDGAKTRMRGVFASSEYFGVLGVTPAFGRLYTAREDSLGDGAHVALLSHRFWKRELGGDSTILGRALDIEMEKYVVIGVLPPEFTGLDLQAADVWIPFASVPRANWMASRSRWWETMNSWGFEIIRRQRGAEDDLAFEQRATLAVRETYRRLQPRFHDSLMAVRVSPFVGGNLATPGQDMKISTRLTGVAAIVLVIACANVINLLLARAVRRRREIAVRLALGISRARLVRLITTETVLLSLLACATALLVALWAGTLLRSLLLPNVVWYESVLHWRVALAALGVAMSVGLVIGIIPALQSSPPDLTRALKEGAREGAVHRSRLRRGLVVVQAAFSLVLLVGASLFVRSLQNVRALDTGYDSDRLLFGTVRFDPDKRIPQRALAATMAELEARLRGRPGVEGVARSQFVPMQAISAMSFFYGSGDSSAALGNRHPTHQVVSAGFFSTVGMRIVRGQPFDGASRQVVVNETAARLLWPNGEALGQCMRFSKRDNPCYTVVGVSENARQNSVIEEGERPQFYLPLENRPDTTVHGSTLIVRATSAGVTPATTEMTSTLRQAFPTGEVRVQPMTETLEPEYRPWVLGARLFTAFGLLALLVALIGIYSTVSYGVTQRTHEFGVRIALGARVADVLSLVVGEGVRLVAVGVAAGVALALAAGKLIASMLYGVSPGDPVTLVVVASIMLATAVAAALMPAWRAARLDPVRALRSD